MRCIQYLNTRTNLEGVYFTIASKEELPAKDAITEECAVVNDFEFPNNLFPTDFPLGRNLEEVN